MKTNISLVMITKDVDDIIEKSLNSVVNIVNEIVIVDDYSTDKTRSIAEKFKAKIYLRHLDSLSKQKKWAIKKTKNQWVLLLDSDEILSEGLREEIKKIFRRKIMNVSAFFIPYQNHFLGKPIKYGGENYQMIRLFRKDKIKIKDLLIHEKVEIKEGIVGKLNNKIYHYSYRSLWQMFKKFTWYGILEAKQRYKNKETSSFKKIFFYSLHMFYARFIEDKDYRDGLWRIPLDLGFAYMEFLTYFLLGVKNFFNNCYKFYKKKQN